MTTESDRVDQHLEMNRRAWDDAHRHLARKRRAMPEYGRLFMNGSGTLTRTEHQLIGDITGLDVLQLSCAGDASQAFSLANMGAKVTACDFSPVAIEEARGNSQTLGIASSVRRRPTPSVLPNLMRASSISFTQTSISGTTKSSLQPVPTGIAYSAQAVVCFYMR